MDSNIRYIILMSYPNLYMEDCIRDGSFTHLFFDAETVACAKSEYAQIDWWRITKYIH